MGVLAYSVSTLSTGASRSTVCVGVYTTYGSPCGIVSFFPRTPFRLSYTPLTCLPPLPTHPPTTHTLLSVSLSTSGCSTGDALMITHFHQFGSLLRGLRGAVGVHGITRHGGGGARGHHWDCMGARTPAQQHTRGQGGKGYSRRISDNSARLWAATGTLAPFPAPSPFPKMQPVHTTALMTRMG